MFLFPFHKHGDAFSSYPPGVRPELLPMFLSKFKGSTSLNSLGFIEDVMVSQRLILDKYGCFQKQWYPKRYG